jgi:hypothetical protein
MNTPTRNFNANGFDIRVCNYEPGKASIIIHAETVKGNPVNLKIVACEWSLRDAVRQIAGVFRKLKRYRDECAANNRSVFEQEDL